MYGIDRTAVDAKLKIKRRRPRCRRRADPAELSPGVNALSALLTDKLPTPVAIENTLVVQMDLDFQDQRCAVWGMTHLDTVRAVELFVAKGYLDMFLDGVLKTET